MAQQEVQLAWERLGTVNPTDTAAIIELQTQAKLWSSFEQWLLELIDKGNNALEVYRHERDA